MIRLNLLHPPRTTAESLANLSESFRQFGEMLEQMYESAKAEDPLLEQAWEVAQMVDPDTGWLDVAAYREGMALPWWRPGRWVAEWRCGP